MLRFSLLLHVVPGFKFLLHLLLPANFIFYLMLRFNWRLHLLCIALHCFAFNAMPQLSSCIPCYAPTFSFTWCYASTCSCIGCLLKLALAPVACFNLFWHLMLRFNFLVQFLALDATLATCRVWSCHILTQEKQEAEDCSKEHLGLKSWKSGKPWIFAGHLEQDRWSAEPLDGKVCAPSCGDITCQSKQNCWKMWEKSPDACVEQQKRMRGGTAWLRQRKLFCCETHETPRTTEWNTVNFPNTWAFLKIVNHDSYM